MGRKLACTLAAGFGLLSASGASAAELAGAESTVELASANADPSVYSTSVAATSAAESDGADSGWQFAFTPYLWASGMKIDVETPQDEEIKVDQSFGDILDILKFSLMGAFEAKHGRIISIQDLIYLSTETKEEGNIGPGLVEAEVDQKLLSTTHLIGYRVVDQGPMFLDLLAGARVTTIKVDLTLTGPLQEIERDNKETNIGPVVAARFRAPLGGKWGMGVYGDLGGFGVTSDISWQLMANVQYDVSDSWRLSAGWRHFEAHQDKNDFDVDLAIDGPILGATYRF